MKLSGWAKARSEAGVAGLQREAGDVFAELLAGDRVRGVEQGPQAHQHFGVGIEAAFDLARDVDRHGIETLLGVTLDFLVGHQRQPDGQCRPRGENAQRQDHLAARQSDCQAHSATPFYMPTTLGRAPARG
jgi:hypothetical protein